MRKKLTFIWPYLKRYRWYLAWGVVALAATNFLALLIPMVLRGAINRIELSITAGDLLSVLTPWIPRIAIEQMREVIGNAAIPTHAALYIVALAVGAGLFRFFTRRTIIWASRKIEYDLRGDLFSHILKLDAGFFDRTPTGDIITRASSDIEQVRLMVGPGIMQGLNTLLVAGFAIPMMAYLDAQLALYVLLPLPLLAVITNVLGQIAHQRFLAIQERFSALSASIQESLAGMRVIKTRVREEETKRTFRHDNGDYFNLNMRLIRLWGGFFPLLSIVSGAAVLLVLYFGGRGVINGEIGLGTFVAFTIYLGMLIWPMIALGWVVSLYQRGTASLSRIQGIFKAQPQVVDPPVERASQLPSPGTLEVRNLSFSYNGSGPVLHDISLEIKPGETVAIAGPTGSGKSTMAQLFWRRYPVPSGTLFFGGVDANDVPVSEWRERVAVVPQEAFLFSDTLRRNIALANPRLTQEHLAEVGELAALNKDIEDFPRGYDTIVGERGITLSGGQKQRATLARALVSPADVLVLDDSFSAIDANTEEEILERLSSIFGSRIIVLITHRISTLKRADRILFIDNGRIADSGTHTEMMERGGPYARWEAREELREKLEEF